MNIPNGTDILKTLIHLLEDQEGVKITYEIETKGTNHEDIQKKKNAVQQGMAVHP